MKKLFLREAKIKDAKLLFEWVNDKLVRENSINQEIIIWENHINWLSKKIINPNTKLFILTDGNLNFGQIRIDRDQNNWIIDYSIDKKFRGNGFGAIIVKLLIEKFDNYKFKAVVKKENLASIMVFLKLGFKKSKMGFDDFEYFEK